jgi:hypothetical protein
MISEVSHNIGSAREAIPEHSDEGGSSYLDQRMATFGMT